MNRPKIIRVAIYARLSVTTEESVSIERQIQSARKYAEARGWQVVLVETDDGVSATANRPEVRSGWRAILDSPEDFQAVIVWKVDRLARRVLDFLNADRMLSERGAGLVAVEDPVDMTTAQGRAFATMLAVFGEMEAAAISARVTAARRAILHMGRSAGGVQPYGFRTVPNPNGPGVVLAHHPDEIDTLREIVARVFAGESTYAIATDLTKRGISPRQRKGRRDPGVWHTQSVTRLLEAPALAGMTPYRGDVIRDRDGLPVVDESAAILTPEDRRELLSILEERKKPRERPATTNHLLAKLVRCGECGRVMNRGQAKHKDGRVQRFFICATATCEGALQISRQRLEEHVTDTFLTALGRSQVVEVVEERSGDPERLAEIEHAISDTTQALSEDGADVAALVERLTRLKELRTEARRTADTEITRRDVYTGKTFREVWETLDTDRERNEILRRGIAAVYVDRATKRGNTFDDSRITIRWAGSPEAEAEGL